MAMAARSCPAAPPRPRGRHTIQSRSPSRQRCHPVPASTARPLRGVGHGPSRDSVRVRSCPGVAPCLTHVVPALVLTDEHVPQQCCPGFGQEGGRGPRGPPARVPHLRQSPGARMMSPQETLHTEPARSDGHRHHTSPQTRWDRSGVLAGVGEWGPSDAARPPLPFVTLGVGTGHRGPCGSSGGSVARADTRPILGAHPARTGSQRGQSGHCTEAGTRLGQHLRSTGGRTARDPAISSRARADILSSRASSPGRPECTPLLTAAGPTVPQAPPCLDYHL